MIHPTLREQARVHPQASPRFLEWLASTEPAPQAAAPKRGGSKVWWVAAGVGVVAVVVAAVLLMLSLFAGGTRYPYLPDYEKQPGVTYVDWSEDVGVGPAGVLSWFVPVPDADMGIAVVEESAGDDVNVEYRGVELATGKVSWTHKAVAHSDVGAPGGRVSDSRAGSKNVLLLVEDAATPADAAAPWQTLAVIKAGDGSSVTRRTFTDSSVGSLVFFSDEVLIYSDNEGVLHALSATDLDKELWAGYSGNMSSVQGKYIATSGGLLDIKTGKQLTITGASSDPSAFYHDFALTDGPVVQATQDSGGNLMLTGVDLAAKRTTWSLQVDALMNVDMAGDLLIRTDLGVVTAYRIKGDSLEQVWSYTIPQAEETWIVAGDNDRVVLGHYGSGDSGVVVLDAKAGTARGEVPEAFFVGMGTKTLYVQRGGSLVAYDIRQGRFAQLWSTPPLMSEAGVIGDHIVLHKGSEGFGIVGTDGTDWGQLED